MLLSSSRDIWKGDAFPGSGPAVGLGVLKEQGWSQDRHRKSSRFFQPSIPFPNCPISHRSCAWETSPDFSVSLPVPLSCLSNFLKVFLKGGKKLEN